MAVGVAEPAQRLRPSQRRWPVLATAGETRWLAAVGAALLLLFGAPWAFSAFAPAPGLEREGTFWFVRDFSQYQAAMREGASGTSWLIHDHFTAEPHNPIFMYPLYVGLGKLAAISGVSPLVIFGAAEWLGRAGLIAALYAYVATFLSSIKVRRLALLLIVGSLGLSGWLLPLRALIPNINGLPVLGLLPREANVTVEVGTLGIFFCAPHLMLGLAFTLLAAPLYLRARSGNRRWLAALGANFALLSLVHPFNAAVPVTIMAVAALTESWPYFGRPTWRRLLPAFVACAAIAPLTLYNFAIFQLSPFWSGTYGLQNLMLSPAIWELPLDLAPLSVAAPFAWAAMRSWPRERRHLLVAWVAVTIAWMYVPVPYQRRFGLGIQPAVGILASVGLVATNEWMRARQWPGIARRAVNYTYTISLLLTPILVFLALLVSATSNRPAEVYLWSRAEADAGRWLGTHTSAADVVLTSDSFSNALVGTIDGRVVSGHSVATRDSVLKAALVKRFYAVDTTPDERSLLLRESGASVVGLGPAERALGGDEAAVRALGTTRLIYDAAGVQWYEVAPAT